MLKADVRTKQSKVIILTSSSTLKELAMSAGADAYFSKPFSPLELLQKIDESLGETFLERGKELRLGSRQSNSVSNLYQPSHLKQW